MVRYHKKFWSGEEKHNYSYKLREGDSTVKRKGQKIKIISNFFPASKLQVTGAFYQTLQKAQKKGEGKLVILISSNELLAKNKNENEEIK